MGELWERQATESHKAFSAFVTYRDMLPAQRSLPVAYRLFMGDPTKAKVSGQWRSWAEKYQWLERVLAYDRYLDAIRRTATETVVAEIEAKRIRQIEISAKAALEETAALAYSNIADVLEWDEEGNVTIKPLKDLPPHVTAAIAKMRVVYDKNGNPNLTLEMHPKVRPLDLLGQHFALWEGEQEGKTRNSAFLDLLQMIRSGALDEVVEKLNPSLRNPPPGIVIETAVPLIPPQIHKEEI